MFVLPVRAALKFACALLLLCAPLVSSAFGLKTHIWIGQQLLSEIRSSCRVEVDGIPVAINTDVCQSIRAHPGAFLSGVLGPDAFPDVITGQVTAHPGNEGDWQTNDWLIHLYSQAPVGKELAFAAGYMVHASSDVFAHTYVNAYAGDIFALKDERRVELRHFLLEKYIDSKLPEYSFDTAALAPPTEYLRDKLIHNADASRLAKGSGISYHIGAMHDIYRNAGNLARELDRIEEDAGKLLANLIVEIHEAELKLADGEVTLKLARETLSGQLILLDAQQELFDAAKNVFDDAADALQRNLDAINLLGLEARAAQQAAEQARQAGKDATDKIAQLQKDIIDLNSKLANVRQYVTNTVCQNEVVDSICGIFCPPCGSSCKNVVKEVCRAVTVLNGDWSNLNDQLVGAQKGLVDAQNQVAQSAFDVAAYLAIETAKLQEKASKEASTAALQLAKASGQAIYDAESGKLDAQHKLTEAAKVAVDTILAEVERLRKFLFDSESIKQAIKDLISGSDILSGLAKNWVSGMEIAGREFIVASDRVSKGMLDGQSNFASTYHEWWKCSGQAYVAIPIQYGQATCAVQDFMTKVEHEAQKIIERTLPPPFNKVYAEYLDIKGLIRKEVKKAVNDASIAFVKLIAPDRTTGEFIELLARPSLASQQGMNDAFASTADSDKPLLAFGRVSDLVDADLVLLNDSLDAQKFAPLKNALTLSKLSLMNMGGLKSLVWVLGSNADSFTEAQAPGRSSIMFDVPRSIDGNHQWQPFGLPYPSAGTEPARPQDPSKRQYGYGPTQGRPGMTMFIDPALRRGVFLRIFDGPLSPSLNARLPGTYPFQECAAHPFAIAFKDDGTGATEDLSCANGVSDRTQRTFSEWVRRFLNWLHINPKAHHE